MKYLAFVLLITVFSCCELRAQDYYIGLEVEYIEECYNDSLIFIPKSDVRLGEIQEHYKDYLPIGIVSFKWWFFENCKVDVFGNKYIYLHRVPTFYGFVMWRVKKYGY